MKIVEVIWHDAHNESTSSWISRDDIDRDPFKVRSVGLLLQDVKDGHVTLVQSASLVDDSLDAVLHIPLMMVQEIREVS